MTYLDDANDKHDADDDCARPMETAEPVGLVANECALVAMGSVAGGRDYCACHALLDRCVYFCAVFRHVCRA